MGKNKYTNNTTANVEEVETTEEETTEEETTEEETTEETQTEETPIETEETQTEETEEEVKVVNNTTSADIAAIINNKEISLTNKLTLVANTLTGAEKEVFNSLININKICGQYAPHEATVNSEQKYFARHFVKLVELEDEKFTMFMRYLRWAFVSLSNGKLAVEENRFTFLNGTTGVDPVNAFAFTHNKEDSEITTFICIFTIMDIQKDAAGTSAAGKINLDKIQSVHNISDALLGRLKKFYA